MRRLVGFLVNPLAGMGGRVGLGGSDGEQRVAEAHRRGARQRTYAAPFTSSVAPER